MAVDKVTPNDRAKAAAARDHACDLLINAFNHLDKLDAQSAGDIVDAIIEAAGLTSKPMLVLHTSTDATTEHAAAVKREIEASYQASDK